MLLNEYISCHQILSGINCSDTQLVDKNIPSFHLELDILIELYSEPNVSFISNSYQNLLITEILSNYSVLMSEKNFSENTNKRRITPFHSLFICLNRFFINQNIFVLYHFSIKDSTVDQNFK